MVLSNVEENILTVDTNGIGYLNEWTFNKTYSRPIVEQIDGKNLEKNLVGFNPSTFYGQSIGDGNAIRSLSFNIVPDKITVAIHIDFLIPVTGANVNSHPDFG